MSATVTYQDDGMVRLRSNVLELQKLKLRVGYQPPEGAERYDSGITVAKLAAVVEFGVKADGIPERSFIRSTMRERQQEIRAAYEAELRRIVLAQKTPVEGLSAVGAFVCGLIRAKLRTAPAWAAAIDPETAERKGHTRPLDETHRLIESLSWSVSIGRHQLARGQ